MPYSKSWMYGAIRHIQRNVDYDAFWFKTKDEEAMIEAEEDINIPDVRSKGSIDLGLLVFAPDMCKFIQQLISSKSLMPDLEAKAIKLLSEIDECNS